jgi:hypothetical protein
MVSRVAVQVYETWEANSRWLAETALLVVVGGFCKLALVAGLGEPLATAGAISLVWLVGLGRAKVVRLRQIERLRMGWELVLAAIAVATCMLAVPGPWIANSALVLVGALVGVASAALAHTKAESRPSAIAQIGVALSLASVLAILGYWAVATIVPS